MTGTFVSAGDIVREQLDWGDLGWMSRPSTTGAEHLTVITVELMPGCGHDFHKHPDQEEVIYVVDGEVEQWIEREKRTLTLHRGKAYVSRRRSAGSQKKRPRAGRGILIPVGGYSSTAPGMGRT